MNKDTLPKLCGYLQEHGWHVTGDTYSQEHDMFMIRLIVDKFYLQITFEALVYLPNWTNTKDKLAIYLQSNDNPDKEGKVAELVKSLSPEQKAALCGDNPDFSEIQAQADALVPGLKEYREQSQQVLNELATHIYTFTGELK